MNQQCYFVINLPWYYQEEILYPHPDDDSPTMNLWLASKAWQNLARDTRAHQDALEKFFATLEQGFPHLITSKGRVEAFKDSFSSLKLAIKRCKTEVTEKLIVPNTNLLDMIYKSIAIRDSRRSLHFSASMWRLSWITIIFLPLTFVAGFFGMNMTTFKDSILPIYCRYAVAASVCFVVLFIILLLVKFLEKPLRKLKLKIKTRLGNIWLRWRSSKSNAAHRRLENGQSASESDPHKTQDRHIWWLFKPFVKVLRKLKTKAEEKRNRGENGASQN
ncbi:hypothetical protein QBC38DRAFT_455952 [Podospora fimiseda]|uniref:Uncharacterized protein n=1 Tax=Podospora fimiseda TaxID=252190 RepID=A0AAN7BNQ1_9PEZI|nr:hypothetical protein QBC38DRAFT_455952 [Podospora fimiseda]